jgi:hypothetical protein
MASHAARACWFQAFTDSAGISTETPPPGFEIRIQFVEEARCRIRATDRVRPSQKSTGAADGLCYVESCTVSVQVRPVQFDDEASSSCRPTRTRAVTLRAGELIEVFDGRRWVRCSIVGQAHSELRVRREPEGPGPKVLTRPEQD